ncbi:MAG: FecR domain-containing protein [Lentimicrobium sp.]|jgi:ferric-dicitrate binding protein FerR (iron transport regulator)|nr:FecR domain-containing protein [Lentimicrobium sp.]
MDPKIIDSVLTKTATPEQARQVAAWFATEEGQAYFAQRYDRESYLLNEKILEEWLGQEIPTKRMKARFLSQLGVHLRTFRFRVAAAVIVPFLLLAGAFAFLADRMGVFSDNQLAEFVVPYGEQLNVVLQDGTQVQLNSGSRLQYPKNFGLFNRKVKLTGEGYFAVAKETTRLFEVDLKDIKVKVTGTHFNAKAYPNDKTIRVALEEGSVNIADKTGKIYPMKVRESAEYDRITGVCVITKASDISIQTAWRTKSLNFYRTPLVEIIKTLERQYEAQFDVNDSTLLNYRFSISTSKINLNEVLSDLEKVSKVKFNQYEEGKYHISTGN